MKIRISTACDKTLVMIPHDEHWAYYEVYSGYINRWLEGIYEDEYIHPLQMPYMMPKFYFQGRLVVSNGDDTFVFEGDKWIDASK